MRTFVALELSSQVHQALADVQAAMRASVRDARWTKPEGTHLTLKFLGEANPDQVTAIAASLDVIAVRFQPFNLILGSVGAFPRLGSPTVLWVGLDASEPLFALHKAIEEAISPLGFPSEKRPFKGHLTLARLQGRSWPSDLRQRFLDSASLCAGIVWEINKVVLFRSELKPGGAVYSAIHASSLG
jgi:2'-5' RNA ligase